MRKMTILAVEEDDFITTKFKARLRKMTVEKDAVEEDGGCG